MTAHTPGPWIFRPWSQSEEDIKRLASLGMKPTANCGNIGERYISSGVGRIASVDSRIERKWRGKNATPYDAPDAERDANARLIAAAPDLLAALEKILIRAAAHPDDNDDDRKRNLFHVESVAYAAIAKASGSPVAGPAEQVP